MPKYTVDSYDAGVELTEDQVSVLREFGHEVEIESEEDKDALKLKYDDATILVEPSIVYAEGIFVSIDDDRRGTFVHLTKEQSVKLRDHLTKLLGDQEPKLRAVKDRDGDIAYEIVPGSFGYASNRKAAAEEYRKYGDEYHYSLGYIRENYGPVYFIEED